MSSLRVLTGLVMVTSFLSACAIYHTAAAPLPAGWPEDSAIQAAPFADYAAEQPVHTKRTDLYGNEVEAAVGEYRFDLSGEMYEAHSPHTALPHLGSPGT